MLDEIRDCEWFSAVNGRCLEYVAQLPFGDGDTKCSFCGKYMIMPSNKPKRYVPLSKPVLKALDDAWQVIKAERAA